MLTRRQALVYLIGIGASAMVPKTLRSGLRPEYILQASQDPGTDMDVPHAYEVLELFAHVNIGSKKKRRWHYSTVAEDVQYGPYIAHSATVFVNYNRFANTYFFIEAINYKNRKSRDTLRLHDASTQNIIGYSDIGLDCSVNRASINNRIILDTSNNIGLEGKLEIDRQFLEKVRLVNAIYSNGADSA